jgi:nicotinamide riboside kinase
VYSQIYNGTCPPWLLRMVEGNLGDLYLLTEIDLPWVSDGIRDRPHQREEIYRLFKTELEERNLPFATISGDLQARLQKAIRAVDEFLRPASI